MVENAAPSKITRSYSVAASGTRKVRNRINGERPEYLGTLLVSEMKNYRRFRGRDDCFAGPDAGMKRVFARNSRTKTLYSIASANHENREYKVQARLEC